MTASLQTQTEEFTANRLALSVRAPGATLVVPPNPVFMNIKPSKVDALKALGYTETEARFLYLVATHSGSRAFSNDVHCGDVLGTAGTLLRCGGESRSIIAAYSVPFTLRSICSGCDKHRTSSCGVG